MERYEQNEVIRTERKNVEQILREFVDGEEIIGTSLIRIDGTVIASHYVGIDGIVPTLIARESLSAKRERRNIFPLLGRLITSAAIYQRMCIGLALVSRDQYIELVAKPELSLAAFSARLNEISGKLRSTGTKR